LGTNNLFIKNVRSGKRTPGVCWGNGLVVTVVSGIFFSGIVVAINVAFQLRIGLWVVLAICVSDLVLMRLTELAVFGFIAMDSMKENAIQNVISSSARLIALQVLIWLPGKVTLERWSVAYLVASAVSTLYALYRAHRLWGGPSFDWISLRDDVVEGVYFSLATSATTIYNDVDKVMLGKVSYVAVGIYAAAYRIVDVAMTPIRSLASAAYPRFFEKGMNGMQPAHAYASTQIKRASVYSLLLMPALWLLAPLLPRVLGANYAYSVPALRWLAVIPVLRGVHVFLADSLSGAGFQGLRSALQVFVALVNVGLNLAGVEQPGPVSLLTACWWWFYGPPSGTSWVQPVSQACR
jgi:O-antigen/teichoic acid export membrane protein